MHICNLSEFSDQELEEELDKRLKEREENVKPKILPVEDRDYSELIKLCQQHIDALKDGEYDSDCKVFIYEAAMVALFGDDVFTWINDELD